MTRGVRVFPMFDIYGVKGIEKASARRLLRDVLPFIEQRYFEQEKSMGERGVEKLAVESWITRARIVVTQSKGHTKK
jgi:hypothetical protein